MTQSPQDKNQETREKAALDRRGFLETASQLAALVGVSGAAVVASEQVAAAASRFEDTSDRPPRADRDFVREQAQTRVEVARDNYELGIPDHVNNGDEARYHKKIGSDTRGLPHNAYGEVDLAAFATLTRALDSQRESELEKIVLGGTRKLVQPLGTLAVNLTGLSAPQYQIPPAPALASAERAAEAVESYWQSLLRDVPFWEYGDDTRNELVLAAAREITQLSGYTGPRDRFGKVTPSLLFRGTARYLDPRDRSGRKFISVVPPGVTVGPYISQFILHDIPYAIQTIPGQLRVPQPGHVNDFSTDYSEWLALQDGRTVPHSTSFGSQRRYLSTGRDLAEYAHAGTPGFWGAALLLGTAISGGGFGAPFSPSNPYLRLTKSASGNATFGLGYIQGLLPLAASREIRANYWQKWFVHRTIRPEAYGGLVHNRLANARDYPIHDDIIASEALDRSFGEFGTYLLSGHYPEGAPNHSSYPGGASSSASVQATLLKAFFDETFVIPDPVQPDPADPSRLIPYVGPPLTVGGELNKLAANLGSGRNWAGIHWRSDAASSLPHAEQVALALLRDEKATYAESFEAFEFSRFDGTRVRI
ncbi:MAG TPA: hypothetical protein VGC79_28190 [Polyangiaceae bacterium]